jgi:hypothetical protein
MAIRITHRRMVAAGTQHEHISRLQGYDDRTQQRYDATRAEWYDFVTGGGYAYTLDFNGDRPRIYGRISISGNKYVQTAADGIWKDNLLALPQY